MAFTGDEGKMIDAATAQKWIDNYEKNLAPGAIKAHFFGFRRFEELLGQDGAIGLRIYYAKDDAGVDQLIVVAANTKQNNIAKIDGSKLDGLVLDHSYPCPPYCGGDD